MYGLYFAYRHGFGPLAHRQRYDLTYRINAYEDATGDDSFASREPLLWRCGVCGELGSLASVPRSCPSCGAPGEEIGYVEED